MGSHVLPHFFHYHTMQICAPFIPQCWYHVSFFLHGKLHTHYRFQHRKKSAHDTSVVAWTRHPENNCFLWALAETGVEKLHTLWTRPKTPAWKRIVFILKHTVAGDSHIFSTLHLFFWDVKNAMQDKHCFNALQCICFVLIPAVFVLMYSCTPKCTGENHCTGLFTGGLWLFL